MALKQKTEYSSDADSSTGSDQVFYVPEDVSKDLEVDDSVYSVLEYISLDWPSQTIDILSEKEVILATNPDKGEPSIVRMDFKKTEKFMKMDLFSFERIPVKESYNRIKVSDYISCISDNRLDIFDRNLRPFKHFRAKFGYGLAESGKIVYSGLSDGVLKSLDLVKCTEKDQKLHEASIESIDVSKNTVFTASCDGSVKIADIRSCETFYSRDFKRDINAISFNRHNHIAFGDEEGKVRIMDIRNMQIEEIEWHKSPISSVKWKNEDEFASCSDEQVALWDKSFIDDWDYHKYLSFVHQGQRYYKDLVFDREDAVLTTSYDGVCVFQPVQS